MYRILPVLFISLAVMACKQQQAPDHILTEQEMVHLLMEIYVAEEKLSAAGIPFDSAKNIFPKFEARIFDKLKVSDSVYLKSMEYYKANPEKLHAVFSAVIDSLNLKAQSAPTTP